MRLHHFCPGGTAAPVQRRSCCPAQPLYPAIMGTDIYLWTKTFHIVMVVSWFAGLFYLPRIFVNLAQVPADSTAERQRLLGMANRLYNFMLPLAILAVISGLFIMMGYRIGLGDGWMHVKLTCVALIIGYHHGCGRLLRRFERGESRRSERWFRVFNEVPVILLLIVVIMVVLKPF